MSRTRVDPLWLVIAIVVTVFALTGNGLALVVAVVFGLIHLWRNALGRRR